VYSLIATVIYSSQMQYDELQHKNCCKYCLLTYYFQPATDNHRRHPAIRIVHYWDTTALRCYFVVLCLYKNTAVYDKMYRYYWQKTTLALFTSYHKKFRYLTTLVVQQKQKWHTGNQNVAQKSQSWQHERL